MSASNDNDQLDLFGSPAESKPAPGRPKPPEPAPTAPHARLPATELDGPLKGLMDDNFLLYASYVIRDRAIPDLADGLKPVQRRILHALKERDDGRFIKVANIVGHTMQYHPHGDASIGDALVALTNKQYLIEGQGNFGNLLTGDAAAAPRYIECRLTDLARNELFNEALTEFVPSYDGRNREPVTLPAKIPLLLMLGAEGIAVGLSTRILPHNFPELLEAQIAILKKKPFTLLPDFPQGGLMDVREYDRGGGRVRVRAVIEKKDAHTLVIREIPFGTTTDDLIAGIEDAARKKKVAIKSINDFTAERIEIALQLAPGADPDKTLDALYAFTPCEAAISSHIVVIQDRRPRSMDVEEILRFNTDRLVRLLTEELKVRRDRLLDELHSKTLVQLFVEHRIYKRIENCKDFPRVRKEVFDGVNAYRAQLRRDIVEDDIDMLLNVPIRRISLFDIEKHRKDMEAIVAELAEVDKHLGAIVPYAINYLKALHKTYAPRFPRRTRVQRFGEIEVRALTATELAMVYDRENGYFGHTLKGDPLFQCSSLDKVMLAWDDGRYRMLPPPDKLFVDGGLLYAARYDRDRVMTAVYTHRGITYLKRFAFGGAIMNKDYRLAPEGSKVLFFSDAPVPTLYVRYAPAKSQRINQQIFHPEDALVKGVSARGQQMTVKSIKSIGTAKPRNWDESESSPKGALLT